MTDVLGFARYYGRLANDDAVMSGVESRVEVG